MQNIIIEKPYKFIPPHRGNWWPNFIQWFNLYGKFLRKKHGIVEHECRGTEHLKASLKAGDGIIIAPNHPRTSDPLVMGFLARECGTHVYAMASWHLFHQDRFTAWAIRKMGGFSLYREGVDRTAINTAIEILEKAERPLILFPEGAVSGTNDKLQALLDGVAFIARSAAKRRAKLTPAGRVVVHPVAVKYLLLDSLKSSVDPVLSEIEQRLSWHSQAHVPLLARIQHVGYALLCLKELEYFGQPQQGTVQQRIKGLIDRLLVPLENEWHGASKGSESKDGPVVPRVKALRMKILPEMVQGTIAPAERQRRWRQLADIYLAQQVASYIPEHVMERPTNERLLETVERFEEDLTDRMRAMGRLKVIIEVGEPIEVSPQRDRAAEADPLMSQLEQRIQAMINQLSQESHVWQEETIVPAAAPFHPPVQTPARQKNDLNSASLDRTDSAG